MRVFLSPEFGHRERETRSCSRVFYPPPEEYTRLGLETDAKFFGPCGCIISEQLLALYILRKCTDTVLPESSIPLLWLCACHLAYDVLDDEELTVKDIVEIFGLKTGKPILDYENRMLVLAEFDLMPPVAAYEDMFALVCQLGSRMPQRCRSPWGEVSEMELDELANFQITVSEGDPREFAKRAMVASQ